MVALPVVVSVAQARAAGSLFGGGANYDMTKHWMVRLEYRVFVHRVPNFNRIAMHTGTANRMAQSLAGILCTDSRSNVHTTGSHYNRNGRAPQ